MTPGAAARGATRGAGVSGGPGTWAPDRAAPVVHATAPLTVETPRDHLGGPVTPVAAAFVRQNLPLPPVAGDPDRWTVEVAGVGRPGRVALAALRGLPAVTRRVVLECAGNGRALLDDPGLPGTPWGTGAVACMDWTGVAVRTVVAALGGVDPAAAYCTATGADDLGLAGADRAHRVERSVPVADALDGALLAWELNSTPIPLVHGGPLRLVVPGFYAVNSVKFLRRLAFTAGESDADIQRVRYRLCPPGEEPGPHHPSLWRLRPKALVCAAGVEVHGVAWAGAGPVRRVEVTVDGGATWHDAVLDPPGDPAAWRGFRWPVPGAAPGPWAAARATDAAGTTQRAVAPPNAEGYANNGWRSLSLPMSHR